MINKPWFKIGSILITIALIVGVSLAALYPRVEVSVSKDYLSISLGLNNKEMAKPPQQQLDPHYYDPVTTSGSPSTNSGLWSNSIDAYVDGTSYASITRGCPSTVQIYR